MSYANSGCEFTPFDRNCGLLHEIVQVTKPTEHQSETVDQYANEKHLNPAVVKELFKATGVLNCGGKVETAQLTGKNNVLTFAAHIFFNPDCTRRKPLSCTFAVDDPNIKPVELDMSERTSVNLGGCGSMAHVTDWGTAKLKTPMLGVRPYDIPSDLDPPPIKPDPTKRRSILQVSSPETGKMVEDCFIMDVDYLVPGNTQTDCNTNKGYSGAAQFIREAARRDPNTGLEIPGKTVIGAINVSEAPIAITGATPGTGYNRDKLFNGSVQLRGDFLKAVRANMGL